MFNKSMANAAYEIISKRKKPVAFDKLFDEVAKSLGMSDEEKTKCIAKCYTQLTIDGRFIATGDNKWDLKSRYSFDKTHVDMADLYSEDEDVEIEDIDEEEDGEEEDEEEYSSKRSSKEDIDGFHIVEEDED